MKIEIFDQKDEMGAAAAAAGIAKLKEALAEEMLAKNSNMKLLT